MVTNNIDEVVALALEKKFAQHFAVAGIDFTVPKGKCYGFLGPNGAGKTTTLKMILGLMPPSAGSLTVFGLPVESHARQIRARAGVVPQTDNLDPDFTVVENLHVHASYFGLPRNEVRDRIKRLLKFADLQARADSKTDSLSGGMKRRLIIARALINEPDLVVLDEPTTGLDPQARHTIWARLMELRDQGKTLILTTHYMEEAERLCDELVIMDHGRILDRGSPYHLVRTHVEPEVFEIRGNTLEVSTSLSNHKQCRLEQIGNSLFCYTHDPKPVLSILQSIENLVFLHRPSGLEDVFLRLTGRELRD